MGSTPSDDTAGWEWELTGRADDQLARLDAEIQERIVSKLDEVVSSDWRDPDEFLEPLQNAPFQKLRVGGYRLGCRLLHEERRLVVQSIRNRDGAYTADD